MTLCVEKILRISKKQIDSYRNISTSLQSEPKEPVDKAADIFRKKRVFTFHVTTQLTLSTLSDILNKFLGNTKRESYYKIKVSELVCMASRLIGYIQCLVPFHYQSVYKKHYRVSYLIPCDCT